MRTFLLVCFVTFCTWSITMADTEQISEPTVSESVEQEAEPVQEPEPIPQEVPTTEPTQDTQPDTSVTPPVEEPETPTEPTTPTTTDSNTDATTSDPNTNSSSTDSTSGGFIGGILDTVQGIVDTVTDLLTATSTPETVEVPEATPEELLDMTTEELSQLATSTVIFLEEDTSLGKLITVTAPNEDPNVPIVDVLASTTIPEIYRVGEEDKIQIKWTNNGDQEMSFLAVDTDENGYLDYIEWTIPHLSTQVFEIIFISKAFHLDTDQTIIADIYDTVKEQDGNYVTVSNGQYIRATFEQILDNTKDNTVYARATDINTPASIEIYPVYLDQDGNYIQGSLVATIENITELQSYRALLTNLDTPTDRFDLKVSGNIEVDLVIDPPVGWTGTGTELDPYLVNSCGEADTSGYYELTTNLTVSSGDCITISANDVTLSGTSTYSIENTSADNDNYGLNNAVKVNNGVTGVIIEDIEIINSGIGYASYGIYNEGTITDISGTVTNSSNGYGIYNESGGIITDISGTIDNSGGGVGIGNNGAITDISVTITSATYNGIENRGVITNISGTFTNSSYESIYNDSGATIGTISGTFTNNSSLWGAINNLGLINDISATIENTSNGKGIDNSGTITEISGTVTNSGSGTGIYNSGGTITNISSPILNDGYGGRAIYNNSGGIITNISSTIDNVNTGDAIYNNNSTITDISGLVNNVFGVGVYNNGGTIEEISGTIDNDSVAGIYNEGTIIIISGTVTNSGSGNGIYNSGGTITEISGTTTNLYGISAIYNNGVITDISGIVQNQTSTGFGIQNYGTIDLISGYTLSSFAPVIHNFGTINTFNGININSYTASGPIGLEGTTISGRIINLPNLGFSVLGIWLNTDNDNDWNNPNNWLLGYIPNKTTDPILLLSSMTLSENISNPIYFAADNITLDGAGLYTVNNSIYGVNGIDEIGINYPTKGYDVNLLDVEFTGNIYGGNGGEADDAANGGSISIDVENLDLSSKTIQGGLSGGILTNGSNGSLTLSYQSLSTNSSTFFNDIGTLIINGATYEDTNPTLYSTVCSNSVGVGPGCVWNGLFNPLIFYYNNATGDGNWNNPLNWWNEYNPQTGIFSQQATTLPISLSQVFIHGAITTGTGAIADTITFNGTSTSAITITVEQNVIFNSSSSNSGTITLGANATFNDSSSNTGSISAATSTFYEDLTSTVGGTVIGFLQRIFRTSATSTRNFITEGGRNDWTIISRGVNTIVNLSDAVYDLATNIFKGLLGGVFVSNETNVYSPIIPQEYSRYWLSITSSADGTKLAAVVFGGQIYTSTDGGISWTPRDSNRYWYSITSSSDGTKLAAVVSGGQIYTSIDSGVTWTPRDLNRSWYSITSSSDGTKLAAVVSGGRIYTSIDSGESWTPRDSNKDWTSITSSSDGTKLAATVYGGQIYTSTDSGVSWIARDSNRDWFSITSSTNGDKLAAVVEGGQIYTSTDSGVNWTARDSSRNWRSITSSTNGDKLAAVVSGGRIYTSTDSGVSWIARDSNRTWYSISSSADGSKFAAAVYGGQIYISESNIGITIAPTISITSPIATSVGATTKWIPNIDWGTATTCEYSYDNYVTMNTLDCAENGADLPRPTAGEHTLSLRATNSHGGLTEKSVTYEYDNTVATYTMCGSDLLDENRPYYYLIQDVTESCTITASQATTTLKGNISSTSTGYTVEGGVVGNTNINLQNITVEGEVGTQSTEGNIIISNSTLLSNLESEGGDITVSNTTVEGYTYSYGGNINIASSTMSGSDNINMGSLGGNITISNSILSNIINSGGGTISFSTSDASENITSAGGNITISNATTTDIYSSGNSNGENAGSITISTSTTGALFADGYDGTSNGGNGGNITITNSYATPVGSTITSNGGSSTSCGNGGNAGLVTLINSTYGTISTLGGNGSDESCPGSGGSSGQSRTPTTQGTYENPISGGGNTGGESSPSSSPSNSSSNPGTKVIKEFTGIIDPKITPIIFAPTQVFTPFGTNFVPNTIGNTNIPDPFKDFKAPTSLELLKIPTNFLTNLSKFLFAPLATSVTDILSNTPKLQAFIGSIVISSEQDLARLATHPEALQTPTEEVPGLFIIKSGEQLLTSYATYDKAVGGLAQLIKVSPNQSLTLTLIPQSTGPVTATYLGQTLSFTLSNTYATTYLTSPANGGRYVLKTESSPLPLLIDVSAPIQQTKKPWGIFNFLWNWIYG